MVIPRPRPTRRRAVFALGLGGLVLAALLSSNVPKALLSPAHGSTDKVASLLAAVTPTPPDPGFRLVDDAPRPAAPPPDALQGSPERRLIAVYRLIAAGQSEAALKAAEALTRSQPKFKLAQLLHADLMLTRTGAQSAFGSALGKLPPESQRDLALLRDEAQLRMKALRERPPAGAIPDEFVSLPSSVRYAIAVDTSHARLYLFENGPQGLQLVEDVYVSVGKQGVDKVVEGDQKTPLGVYFTTDQLDPRSLQERFGAGALPLNYPNAYDKLKGRTGSGILLHGVTNSTYSRPPLDSDGCVAMANDDLQRLAARLPQRDTPVVITREIRWVTPAPGKPRAPEGFEQAFKAWQSARLATDVAALVPMYDAGSGPSDGAADLRLRQRLQRPANGFEDVSVLTWHDDQGKLVVTFREQGAGPNGRDRLMRQYWAERRGEWRIVAEGPVR